MSTSAQTWTNGYHAGFYWTGLVTALASIVLACAGNTELFYRVEHSAFPLVWAFAGVAILEFVLADICHHAGSPKRPAKNRRSRQPAGLEAVEA